MPWEKYKNQLATVVIDNAMAMQQQRQWMAQGQCVGNAMVTTMRQQQWAAAAWRGRGGGGGGCRTEQRQ